MNIKRILMALALFSMVITGTASAEVIGTCELTGYTYMGGLGATTTYPESSKDYFVATALELFGGDSDMWGYSWLKFEVTETETVESAYLVLDLLGVGAMSFGNPEATTEELVASLDLYDPGDVDVETLDKDTVSALRDTLLTQTALSSLTMTSNGTYYLDITDLYNSWILDPDSNNGIILASGYNYEGYIKDITQEYIDSLTDEEYNALLTEMLLIASESGSVYASFGNENGSAPYISSTVPVPGTLMLLGCGLAGLAGLRRARH